LKYELKMTNIHINTLLLSVIMHYIIVTGGVISGLGKGITASSVGLILQQYGYSITAIKIDPYLNIDAGTMSPYEHGECYVLSDGGESDLDLGNYERFLDIELTKDHNITTGKVYSNVIQKERAGEYLGKTVQVVPHIVNEITDWIQRVSKIIVSDKEPDICIIELGGTIGDIETAPFIEALRLLNMKEDNKCCFIHVTLIVDNGEPKTKPTQQSIKDLRSLGVNPNFIVLRAKSMLDDNIMQKISVSCSIPTKNIICNYDTQNIYIVPDIFMRQQFGEMIMTNLGIEIGEQHDLGYKKIYEHYMGTKKTHTIHAILKNNLKLDEWVHYKESKVLCQVGIAGKYVNSQDTYLSLIRAIDHASFVLGCDIKIIWIDTEQDDNILYKMADVCDAIIIPGGFGTRGIDGKLSVCKYARDNNIPLLGICLGMQIMVIEYARSLGYDFAMSREWVDKANRNDIYMIDILPGQNEDFGGTMRLGNYNGKIIDDEFMKWYDSSTIIERHRHRYEMSIDKLQYFDTSDLVPCVINTQGKLVEAVRLKGHKYIVGCQYHPEYRSRFNTPHPLFVQLLEHAI
jgi:CTP synthase